jgi:DNA-binding NarL/FixJ family response regulator
MMQFVQNQGNKTMAGASMECGTIGGTNQAGQIKVFLVEDHVLFRTQLAKLIQKTPRMSVCGESDNTGDALRMIEAATPDLVIADITLKGSSGLELIKDLRARGAATPVLVLSMHDELMYAERALRAGASGYVAKHQLAAQLREAMDTLLDGGVYFSSRMKTRMLQSALINSEANPESDGVSALTDREDEIFRLIGKGFTTKDIARQLHLGEKTVHSHRFQIKAKLGLKHSAALYNQATRWSNDQPPKAG